ncbi:uncharacterized protein VICG_00039 [Vittaforma corneae ATCC 50505]|uniref:GDP-mannose transporter n=1 Tax=Vittaforma corneae (strain ATCC 50505) TaxID=993615 RepID=L2GQ41_VITCO|nr:uncharacterized protein VICG_00039 [Vittaforma corneae ATCC 50505]ELA42724.1 hypothetical protein VICG_00039 [Vittaforma corneae ATCC 50505]
MRNKIFEKSVVVSVYLASSAITFDLNKYIISVLNFKMHYLLIIVQSILIVGIILGQSLCTKTSIHYSNINKWWITSALLTAMMFTNMKALYYIPLSLFTLYKNSTIILIAILELYFFGKSITVLGCVSFVLMISSSLFGNTVDKIELVGYYWMVANIFSTAAYILYLKKLMVVDMSTRTESVFFTNLLSVPTLFLLSMLFDPMEIPKMTLPLIISIIGSGIAAYFTSFSTAWSMKILSSTSYSMLGAMNKLIVSASGFLVFDENFERVKMLALLVGILSGMVYSLDSIRKRPSATPS